MYVGRKYARNFVRNLHDTVAHNGGSQPIYYSPNRTPPIE